MKNVILKNNPITSLGNNKAVKETKVAVNILKTTPNDFNVLTLLRIFSYNP